MQVQKSTGDIRFSLTLSRHPPNPAVPAETLSPVDLERADVCQAKLVVLRQLASPVDKSTESLLSSKLRHQSYFDARLRQLVTTLRVLHLFVDRVPHQTKPANHLKNSHPIRRSAEASPKFFVKSVALFASSPPRGILSRLTLTACKT